MFFQATSFDQPLGAWNVSKVTIMSLMFYGATKFNQPIGAWNVSDVTNMNSMFEGAISFNQDLCPWYKLLSGNTTVEKMLYSTNCTDSSDPDLDTKLSFCQVCAVRCARPTVSPTSMPSMVPTAQPYLVSTNVPTDNNAPTSNSSFAPTNTATLSIFPSNAPEGGDIIFR
jgi:surface protein